MWWTWSHFSVAWAWIPILVLSSWYLYFLWPAVRLAKIFELILIIEIYIIVVSCHLYLWVKTTYNFFVYLCQPGQVRALEQYTPHNPCWKNLLLFVHFEILSAFYSELGLALVKVTFRRQWPYSSYLTSLGLSFIIYKMGEIMVTVSMGLEGCEDEISDEDTYGSPGLCLSIGYCCCSPLTNSYLPRPCLYTSAGWFLLFGFLPTNSLPPRALGNSVAEVQGLWVGQTGVWCCLVTTSSKLLKLWLLWFYIPKMGFILPASKGHHEDHTR